MSGFVDRKFRRQVNEVRVPVQSGTDMTAAGVDALIQLFCEKYEELYGAGTAYTQAGIELGTLRLTSTVTLLPWQLKVHPQTSESPQQAFTGRRPVYFSGDFEETKVYDAALLQAGNVVQGPAIIESAATSLPVHPGQTARIDEYLNVLMELG